MENNSCNMYTVIYVRKLTVKDYISINNKKTVDWSTVSSLTLNSGKTVIDVMGHFNKILIILQFVEVKKNCLKIDQLLYENSLSCVAFHI